VEERTARYSPMAVYVASSICSGLTTWGAGATGADAEAVDDDASIVALAIGGRRREKRSELYV
jgi:hypothetical protein